MVDHGQGNSIRRIGKGARMPWNWGLVFGVQEFTVNKADAYSIFLFAEISFAVGIGIGRATNDLISLCNF